LPRAFSVFRGEIVSATSMLDGVRVLDMTSVMFGPYCTTTLANLGADVVKIEPLAGDELRRVGKPAVTRRMGPAHLTMNRGKRSVVWDLKTAKGKASLHALLSRSDVFIHNLRSDAIARLGLGYEEAKAIRKDIIYVHCTGFGSGGPYSGLAAYDDIIQSASGATSLLPRVSGDGPPQFLPMAMADKVSALHAVYAVLAALFHRERTGEGQAVEIPMFESFTHFLLQEHLYGRTLANPTEPAGYPRQLDRDRQPMRTADGWITVAPYTDERWVRFFELVGQAEFLQAEELSTPIQRLKNLSLLQRKMAEIMREKTTESWLDLLSLNDIPAFRVNSIDDLFADPHLNAVGFFRMESHPTEGGYVALDPPVRFSAGQSTSVRHAPLIGEHTDEIQAWLDRGESKAEN
jgi:crotonobetainyl-CoA:carnitine CoA-transferase CaiB-like acyl-CoA transferase